jgi:uncharacterized protein YndB with AHSA1/START domain
MTTNTTPRELTLTRTFDAPRQLVWDAHTVAEQLAKWWGPSIMHTPLETITIELHTGGAFRLTMVSDIDGAEYPSEMTIREVVPIERLVYGWDAQGRGITAGEVTVTLTEDNGQTLLVQRFVGEISEDMFPMMKQGTNEQLDKLDALLAPAA